MEDKLTWVRALVAENPDKVAIALRADDVERLKGQGKIAIILGFLNALALDKDLERIDWLYEQGVRIFGMNHAGHNDWSDSSRPFFGDSATLHGGLSPLGEQAIPRLNDLGIVIDVSQQSRAAALRTVELSRAPVIASHSPARGLVNNIRNISDEEADAIQAKGGVVHVPPFSPYLVKPDKTFLDQIRAIRIEYGLSPEWVVIYDDTEKLSAEDRAAYVERFAALLLPVMLSDYVDHIDYLVRRIGWQHVGIGIDFNQGGGVTGFDSADEALNVTAELVNRGYSEEQIDAIWGQNLLRVMRAAETAASTRGGT